METSPLGWGRQSGFLTYMEVALYRRLWPAHSQERQMDVDWEERNSLPLEHTVGLHAETQESLQTPS